MLVDRTWTCTGPVNIPLVRVTMRAGADGIHLREDCSGRIGRIEVDTWTLDGMKVNAPAPAAHDLVIEGGYIRCHDSEPNAHQDGIQAMGGSRIRLVGLELNCNSGPNAQLFIAAANGGTADRHRLRRLLPRLGRGIVALHRHLDALRRAEHADLPRAVLPDPDPGRGRAREHGEHRASGLGFTLLSLPF